MPACKKEIELILKYCNLDVAEARSKVIYSDCKTDEEVAAKLFEEGSFNFNILCQYELQDKIQGLTDQLLELNFHLGYIKQVL